MNPLYTQTGYRVSLKSVNAGVPIHWLFLPGGPGLGSESFSDLGVALQLPGNTWYVDYPNDGRNQISKVNPFDRWSDGLIELLNAFENVVLVAHSFSGMFVLSEPRIEKIIKGLVLMNTSPTADWVQEIPKQAERYNLPDVSQIQAQYQKNPSDKLFKKLTLACAPYFFSRASLEQGMQLLEGLPYSHASYDWAGKYFHPNYKAAFVPKTIPTLIIGSEFDHITPVKLFSNNELWCRKNILVECLKGSGHFPWFDSPDRLCELFMTFSKKVEHHVTP